MEAVVELANRYKASVTATARRFAEIGPWRCGFVFWEKQVSLGTKARLHPRNVYKSRCAVLISRDKIVASEGSQFYRALDSDRIVKGRESLNSSGCPIYIESMKLGQGVMSMAILEPHAEILAAKKQRPVQRALFR